MDFDTQTPQTPKVFCKIVSVASLPSFLLILLPKCPLCSFGLLAILGMNSVLLPLEVLCVLPMAVWLVVLARKSGKWRLFVLYSAILGVVLIVRLHFQPRYTLLAFILVLTFVFVRRSLSWMASKRAYVVVRRNFRCVSASCK